MYMSSTHYLGICVLCAHYLQWSLIYSFLTDNADVIHMSSLVLFIYPIMYNLGSAHCLHKAYCPSHLHVVHTCTHHLLVIFTTPHIPYYPELSFCTLSAQMHIVHVICMLSTHVHIICLSSLPLFIYLIFQNLVSAHCLHTCILSMSSVYCLEMHVMYMSSLLLLSVYVHVIYILSGHICIMCTLSEVVLDIFLPNRQYQCHPYIISSTLYIFYYVQLSFRTLSTQMHIVHVICMLSAYVHIICLSSLTLLVYPIIHNLVSAHCLHTHIVHVICMLSAHIDIICLSSLTLLIYPIIHNLISVHIVFTHAHCQYHVYIVYRCICYVHLISTAVICICTCHPHII